MCHGEGVWLKKAIYIILSGSAWISYRGIHVSYRIGLIGTFIDVRERKGRKRGKILYSLFQTI